MTRHGMAEPSTAGAEPPATDQRASTVNIAADSFTTSLVQDRQDGAEAQRSRLFASNPALPSVCRTIADIGSRSKSP
jgi:hypothetical protein